MMRLILTAISLFCYVITAQAAPADDFVTTWQTDHPGASNSTSIILPMVGGPYDVDLNNNGIFDEFGLYGAVTHDYGVAGVYTVRIRGTYDSIQFNNGGDKEKISSIDQWGTQSWTSMERAFFGAANLRVPAIDIPDFSAVTDMSYMFSRATSVNPDTSGWDTAAITDMSYMFSRATSANPDTSDWDTSSVTDMSHMFQCVVFFDWGPWCRANPDTSGWDTSAVRDMSGMFDNTNSANPDTSGWDTSSVTDMSYIFYYATSVNPNTSGWDTSAVRDMRGMFLGATSANPDTSGWDTSAVTTMHAMFSGATSANPDTSGWDTSAVTTMQSMFSFTTSVNPDTSGWDTSAVTTMQSMFSDATSANPNTSGWDTSSVTNMFGMFRGATSANPDTSGWDTAAVTGMSRMFSDATSANPDTSGWDTVAVTDMLRMFSDATSANPDTSGWDTSAVITMREMFYYATSANPDTSGWDTSAVTTMQSVFSHARSANPDTSGWDTSAVTNMVAMFYAANSANPDTSGWDTSSVRDMRWMFWNAISANPDVSRWATPAVTDMHNMFSGATSFDRDLGSWNVTSLTDATNMFTDVTLSTANYDSLLTGWNAQSLQPGVDFDGGNSTYCSATAIAARTNMIASDSWVITDGGQICPPLTQPTTVRATDGTFTDRVRVTFNLVAGATVYRVFRCPDNGNTCGLPFGYPKTGTFDDKNAVPGITYFYRVRACTTAACGKFSVANTGFVSTAPAIPSGINATDGKYVNQVQLTWDTVAGATVYRVFLCVDESLNCGSPLGFPKSPIFNDLKGIPEHVYFYRVKACTTTNCSDFSTADTGYGAEQPDRPIGIRATDGNYQDRVEVSWNPVTDAVVYRVFRCMDTGQTCGSPVGFPNGTSFNDKKGDPGTVYYYRIKACTTEHCSKFSVVNAGHRGSTPSTEGDDIMLIRDDVPIPSLNDTGRWLLILMSLGLGLLLITRREVRFRA